MTMLSELANDANAGRSAMADLLDLERFPIDQPTTPQFKALVRQCQDELDREGMFNLPGLVRPDVVRKCAATMQPLLDSQSFTHKRFHNVYFLKKVPGLDPDHPALATVETVNHTLCGDQIQDSAIDQIYRWEPVAAFLATVMGMEKLFVMDDLLAGANVISYRAGETLNWHFDRSQFTTTLLIQAPEVGGEFMYRSNLRSETDPNYDGVARLLRGEDDQVRKLMVTPGTLNVFKGRNTLHRVNPPAGTKDRIIAIFSYYDRPGVRFSPDESIGFYGRAN